MFNYIFNSVYYMLKKKKKKTLYVGYFKLVNLNEGKT